MSALLHLFHFRSLLRGIRATLIFLVALAAGGCSTSGEDQRFFERGWLWPRNLDTPDRPVTDSEKRDAAVASGAADADVPL